MQNACDRINKTMQNHFSNSTGLVTTTICILPFIIILIGTLCIAAAFLSGHPVLQQHFYRGTLYSSSIFIGTHDTAAAF